jgi:hypothetical protein
MRKRLILATVAVTACFGAAAPGAEEGSSNGAPIYTPQVSDFMSETQLRHFKLWFSGSLANWPLAHYELEKMKLSLDAAARLGPHVGYPNFTDLLKADGEPGFEALNAAIAAKSETAFLAGFKRLTQSCNACHDAAGVGFIKIQTPTASPFSDQNFAP